MSVSIDKELLVRTIENSKKFNYVYDDVVIDGWTFKKVPVKKDLYTSENMLSGKVAQAMLNIMSNRKNECSEVKFFEVQVEMLKEEKNGK